MSFRTRILNVIIFLVVVSTLWTIPVPVAAHPVQSLPVGSYWTVSTTNHRTTTGSGSDSGTFTRDEKWTEKFTVRSHDANTITITDDYEGGSWSSTASDTWVKANGGATSQGQWPSSTNDYTINAATVNVTAVSNNDYKDDVGQGIYFLINPQGLSVGNTVNIGDDYKVSSSQRIKVKGVDVDAWALTWTCDGCNGYWNATGTYSKGQETWTNYCDKTYGIFLGLRASGNYEFTRQGGGWKETMASTSQVSDTNINFSRSSTPSFLMQPYVLGGIVLAVAIMSHLGGLGYLDFEEFFSVPVRFGAYVVFRKPRMGHMQ